MNGLGFAPNPIGIACAFFVLGSVAATVWWMLHPPVSKAERAAQETEQDVRQIIGSVIIVFAERIHSEHMMSLAVRLARRERVEVLAAYIIEVPHTLPMSAEMEEEKRHALDVLQTAEAIGRRNDVEIEKEVRTARRVHEAVLELARERDAHLIVIGAFREGIEHVDRPLGDTIQRIAGSYQS